jgi:hypothetical protein
MNWPDFAKRLLLEKGSITDEEARHLRRAVLEDGTIDRQEVEFLIDLKRSAAAVSPAFDRLLLAVMKRVVLADGFISDAEAAWLERTLFADQTVVTDMTIRFLRELGRKADRVGMRFARLYKKWVNPAVKVKRVNPLRPEKIAARTRPAQLQTRLLARPRTGTTRS